MFDSNGSVKNEPFSIKRMSFLAKDSEFNFSIELNIPFWIDFILQFVNDKFFIFTDNKYFTFEFKMFSMRLFSRLNSIICEKMKFFFN